jgi:AAT family amino acid transporter
MVHDNHGLKRSLQPRHIRLMALGSTIGVGLFLGSATAIQLAGPSIMLGYVLAGLVAFIVLRALGEMAVHEPVAGSFAHYAGKYIGPLAGYLVGWGYWTYWIVVGLAEVTAVGIYMMMWFPDVPQWVWALSSLLAMGGINFVAVKVFGEFEFWFSLIKVVAIVTMIAMGCGMIFFGLGVGGERQLGDVAVPHQGGELLAERLVHLFKHRFCGWKGFGECLAHADFLAALPGKNECEGHVYPVSLVFRRA